jgi:lipopolysaccharide export system permease protein
MSIIAKYLIKEIIKYFGIILIMVVGIYLVVDFLEKIDDFLEAGLSFSHAFTFFFYKTPFIIAQITPVGVLLSVLVTFGLMNRNNELIALKTSGISIFYLVKPIIFLGIGFTLLQFLMAEVIVPVTTIKANQIWLGQVRNEAVVTAKEKNIWIKGDRLIAHIKYYDPAQKTVFGITIHAFDENFRMIQRMDAQRGVFAGEQWIFYNIMTQTLKKESGLYQLSFDKQKSVAFHFQPVDFKRVIKKSEEMSYTELESYIEKIESEGYNALKYRIDLYAKIAFPFICIIMSIVGVGIGVHEKVKEGLPMGIAVGIGITFLYWVFYSFCISLGYGEVLPDLAAVWSANAVFFCFAIFNLLSAD